MTLSQWIKNYCAENDIELPDGIPSETVALTFLDILSKNDSSDSGSDDSGGDSSASESGDKI